MGHHVHVRQGRPHRWLKADISNLEPVHVATTSTGPIDSGFKRAVADGDLGRSFRTWAHTFITKPMAIESGLLAASGEVASNCAKPAARLHNFQATSAAATAKGTEESKGEETQFSQLMTVMATQNAQNEQGLAQMREAQAQTQQAQAQIMQMITMIFSGQQQQRVTNGWVAKSMEAISTSSGCVIEAAPSSQEIIELPPALVRMATQPALGGAPPVGPMVAETVEATAAAAAAAPAAAVRGGVVHRPCR